MSKPTLGRAVRLVALTLLAVVFGAVSAQAQAKAYVANNGDDTLSVIDVATNTVIGTIPVAGGPQMLVISPDNSRAYVTTSSNGVAVVDLATSSVIANVTVDTSPFYLTQSLDGAFVYVNNFDLGGTTSVIDTATNTVAATLTIGAGPANGIAATPDGASVWTANGKGVISVINTATNTITQPTFSTPGGFRPFGIAFTPNGAFAYLANGTAAGADVMDTVTHAVVATIPVTPDTNVAFTNAITPNGATVYQTSTDGHVTMIDTATNTVVATLSLGGSLGVAITADGAFAYVADDSDNSVSVISTATHSVVATIPVGNAPIGVAITHVSNVNAPPVLASNNASVTVNEGQTAANTGTVTDATSVGTVVNNGNGTWSWSFLTSDGPTQSQTVTITGNDGHGGTSTTTFALVVNNVAPTIVSVTNNGPVVAGHAATITVTATDPAGANDPLAYSFDCNNDGGFEIGPQSGNSATCTFATAGSYTVRVRVADDDGGVTLGSTVVTVRLPPPSCANATASPNLLWPPNHKFVAIQISGIVNPAPGAVTIKVTSIFQDEPVSGGPDATGVGTGTPSVRSERYGGGDGRVYHIIFTATGASGSCTGSVTVGVPHDQGHGGPVDQGALYDSTTP